MNKSKLTIVETKLIAAKSLACQLKKMGYHISAIVDSGEAAIESVRKEEPDLILMDIALAGKIDGIQAASEIWNRYDIPVLYLTENSDRATLERAKLTCSFGYVVKPFKRQELQANIEIALTEYKQNKKMREQLKSLEKRRRRAEAASEIKSRYVSMVSHEIRNPLTTILISSQLLAEERCKLPPEQEDRYIDRIQAAAKTINQLLEDVLMLGKVELQGQSFQPAPLNVLQFCCQLLEELQVCRQDSDRRIILVDRGGFLENEEQPLLDEKLLRQILLNLLSNALKYSPQGSPVYLTVDRQANLAIFEVRDKGIGIPAADHDKLFQTFYRSPNAGKIPGTGLGLAIVKQLVELHGGTIKVASQVGAGTTFTVTLPVGGLVEAKEKDKNRNGQIN